MLHFNPISTKRHLGDRLSWYPHLWSHYRIVPLGWRHTALFDWCSACSHGSYWSSVSRSSEPRHTNTHMRVPERMTRWTMKAARQQDLYQIKIPPPISPTTDQHSDLAQGDKDADGKETWIYLSPLVQQASFVIRADKAGFPLWTAILTVPTFVRKLRMTF